MKQLKLYFYFYFYFLFLVFISGEVFSQTTSWKGTTSTSWSNAANWTNGIPSNTTDVIIGDANFTGASQPTISSTATAKSITIGAAAKASTLTISRGITVSGDVVIGSNGTINHGAYTLTLTGNWTKAGTYNTTSSSAKVTFAGTTQTINASGTTQTFRKLTINTGSTVTANVAFAVSGSSSILTVSGTFNPASFQITGTGALTVKANAAIHVKASTFAGSYGLSGTITLSAGNTVNYSATADQTVSNSFTYSTLRIGGSGIKSLTGNLPTLRSAASTQGNIYVDAGTFDLSSFTAARGTSVTGGTFSVANGATLKIGGTNTFPANYSTRTLGLTSTVEYSGAAQAVSLQSYGNLTLSASSGSVSKTMPASAMIIAGNLTSNQGSGTALSFQAGNALTVTGNLFIGSGTTFDASSFSHNVGGNMTTNGTFTGSSGAITMTGPTTQITGSGTHNFNDLTIVASGVTATVTTLNVSGNLATSGAGTFTHTPAGTLVMSGTSKSISGTGIVLDNLTLSGSISTAASFTLTGNLAVAGSLSASSGTITMSGSSKAISGSGSKSFSALAVSGTLTTSVNFSIASALTVSGSLSASTPSVATFTGSTTLNGTANLYGVVLNGTELKLSTNAVLGIGNGFTITSGTLNVTSTTPNTVDFNGSGAQNINGITYNNLSLSGGNTKTALAAFTVNGNFGINSSTTFAASSFTHNIYGNWTNSGTFTAGSGTIAFLGAINSTVTGATTFNILTINKSSSATGITLLSNVSVPVLNMTTGWMNTGSNTLTITNTRNGAGLIYGNIQRTHAFSAATAYAFEGLQNTLTFSAANSVTSVTVSVTEGAISDFPFNGSVSLVYTVSVTGSMGSATVGLRLHYQDNELNGNNESTMQLWRYTGSAWALSGKTSNDNSLNYVDQSGISNTIIQGRWTLSDDANVVQWNGNSSTLWSDAGNWSVVQGSATTPPSSGDIVQLGSVALTNQPTINTAGVNVKNIVFGSAQAVTLTIATGGSLTTNAINGIWSGNANHTIAVGAQTLTVNGDLTLSDETANHTINLGVSSGAINVAGTLTESGSANITFTGAGSISIGNNFAYTSGTFTPGSGTVIYNGAQPQSVAGVTYNNLTINKSAGVASKNAAGSVNGNLSVVAGELDINAATTISGDVTIASGAILNGDGVVTTVSGNWSNSGTFISATGTIALNGTGNQSVTASTFNNFTINKASGTVILSGNIALNGNLTLQAGVLELGGFTANRGLLGGIFTMQNGTGLTLTGSNFPSSYSTYTLGETSTVTYNGSSTQTVTGITYGNLVLTNGSTNAKTIGGPVSVMGDLTINSGATLNGSTQTITLNGNWNNSGTYTPSTSTVVFSGTSKTISGNTTFNRMTIKGTYTVNNNNIIINDRFFVVASGSYAAGSGTHTVNGDLVNSGILTSTGTTTFTGNTTQTIQLLNAITSNSSGIINFNGTVPPVLNSTSMPTFANLNINNTGGVTASVDWKILISFTIGAGATFNAGAFNDTISGNFTNNGTITSSGLLFFNPSSFPVTLALGSTLSSTGTVRFGGTSVITISGTPAALNDVIISNNNAAGISPPSGWTIGGTLTIRSNAILNAGSFSYSVADNLESNGTLNGGTSTFTMSSSTGELSGSGSTTFNHFIITGNLVANSDFNVSGDFTNNGTYDGSVGTLIMTGSGPSLISGSTSPSTIAQVLNAKTNASTTLGVNISTVADLEIRSGTFNTSTFTISQSAGTLKLEDNATLQIGGVNTLPVFDTYEIDTLSTVEYNGSGSQAVSSSVNYGNLILSGSNTKTVGAGITILNNFSLTGGTFTGGNFTHTVKGNWTMTGGTFTNTGTTILFNGTASQTIKSTGAFNSVTLNKPSGSVYDSTDVTVNGTLSLTGGNIVTGTNKHIMGASGSVSYTSGHIIGNLQKNVSTGAVSRTFEIGDETGYTPLTIAFASVTVAGNLVAATTSGEHTDIAASQLNASRSVNRSWTLTGSGITFTNYNVTFNFLAGDVDGGATTGSFYVAKKSGGSWLVPTVGTRTSTSTQATAVTTFGEFVIGELAARVWDGGAGTTNWNDAANWGPDAVPSAAEDAWVKSAVTVQVNSGVSVGGLTLDHASAIVRLQTGGTLTINNVLALKSGELQMNGQSLTLNGTIDASGTGTIKGDGNALLTIGGTSGGNFGTIRMSASSPNNRLLNFTLNRTGASGSVLIGSNGLEIVNAVTLTNGTLNTGGNLVLLSNAAGTARIGAINEANATISGNVTVQRYIPAVARRSRMLSAPVSNFNFSQYKDDIFISGPGGVSKGFDSSTNNGNTIYVYRESTSGVGRGWKGISTINDSLTPASGALVFIRGDRSLGIPNWYTEPFPAQTEVTINYTSQPVNKGTISPAITYTNTGAAADDGWNVVGNPYPSQINWNNVSKNNITPFFYTLNPATGSYVADDGTNLIASGQAFFIQAVGALPSITFTENSKATAAPVNYFKTGGVSITATMTKDSFNSDLLKLFFSNGANSNYDPMEDAAKLTNSTVNFASFTNDGMLVQYNNRPHLSLACDTIHLYVNGGIGNYTLNFSGVTTITSTYQVSLFDRYTNTTQDLRVNAGYAFNITSVAQSKGGQRFSIIFSDPNTLPVSVIDFSGQRINKDVELKWRTATEKNSSFFILERSLDNKVFEQIGIVQARGNSSLVTDYTFLDKDVLAATAYKTGNLYYRLVQVDRDGTKRPCDVISIPVKAQSTRSFVVYPNPTKDYLVLQSELEDDAPVYIEVVDAMNKTCLSGDYLFRNGRLPLNIEDLETGIYFLRFRTLNEEPVVMKFLKH